MRQSRYQELNMKTSSSCTVAARKGGTESWYMAISKIIALLELFFQVTFPMCRAHLIFYCNSRGCLLTCNAGGRVSRVQFTWKIRSQICIGVAQGLAFLHEEVRPHIIHRDIKASNVLLDKDFKAKISDFGLAKLFPTNATHISTRVAGTQ